MVMNRESRDDSRSRAERLLNEELLASIFSLTCHETESTPLGTLYHYTSGSTDHDVLIGGKMFFSSKKRSIS